MVDYIVDTVNSMKMIKNDLAVGIIYILFKKINEKIMNILSNNTQAINIAGLHNLELDLICMFSACG